MNELGSGISTGGAAFAGGSAGVTPVVNLNPAGGGYGMPYPVMMGGCNNGFGGGFGGDGIWAILLLALLGRGGIGGGYGNDCGGDYGAGAIPTILSDNINGRFAQLSDQISAGDAAIIANNNQQSIVSAVRDVDGKVCDTQALVSNGFGQSRLDAANGFALTNSNIKDAQYASALESQRLAAQMATCCCETQKEILMSRCGAEKNTADIIAAQAAGTQKVLDKLCQSEIQGLRDQLAETRLGLSQCGQNATLINALRPTPVPSYPVYANAPIFNPVVSADSFCGFGNSSFNRGCGSCL